MVAPHVVHLFLGPVRHLLVNVETRVVPPERHAPLHREGCSARVDGERYGGLRPAFIRHLEFPRKCGSLPVKVHLCALIDAGPSPAREYLLPPPLVVLHPGELRVGRGGEAGTGGPYFPGRLPEHIQVFRFVDELVDVGALVREYRYAQKVVLEDQHPRVFYGRLRDPTPVHDPPPSFAAIPVLRRSSWSSRLGGSGSLSSRGSPCHR